MGNRASKSKRILSVTVKVPAKQHDQPLSNTTTEEIYRFTKIAKEFNTNSYDVKKLNNFLSILEQEFKIFLEFNISEVNTLALTEDTKYIVSGSKDAAVRVFNTQTMTLVSMLRGHIGSVNTIAITNNNKYIISGSDDYTIIIWNFQEGIKEAALTGHASPVKALVLTSDNAQIVSDSVDMTIRIWTIEERLQKH